MSLVTSGINEGRSQVTVRPVLGASPNPFSNATTVHCSSVLPAGSSYRLYDAAGNLVRTLSAGATRTIDGAGLAPGVYLLRAGDQSTRLVKVAH